MSARGMSARGLKAFLLVAAIVTFVSPTSAADVTLKFVDVNPGYNVKYNNVGNTPNNGTEAGQFNWKWQSQTGGPALGTLNSNVQTFCIELAQTISGGNNYTYRIESDISTLPLPGGGMGGSKANIIQALVNHYVVTNLASHLIGLSDKAAVMQAAIWEVVHENTTTPYSRTTGNFKLDGNGGINADFESSVNNLLSWLNVAANITANTGANQNNFALGLTSNNNQDQITIVDRPTFVQFVPVPTGVVMAGMGIVCLGGVNFLRRRKVVAAV